MILERSGVMYDPAVVAALLRIKDEIWPSRSWRPSHVCAAPKPSPTHASR